MLRLHSILNKHKSNPARLILTFLLISPFNLAEAQMNKNNALWYYSEPKIDAQYMTLNVTKDTVVSAFVCKQLHLMSGGNTLIGTEYLRTEGKKNFYLNTADQQFHLLYDFAANVGDTIKVHDTTFITNNAWLAPSTKAFSKFQYVITSIDTIIISGKKRIRQKVKSINNQQQTCWLIANKSSNGEGYLIEDIGSLHYYFGVSPFIAIGLQGIDFRCYSDSSITYKSPQWQNLACDYITSIFELNNLNNLVTFPNPATNQLHVQQAKASWQYEIMALMAAAYMPAPLLPVLKYLLAF